MELSLALLPAMVAQHETDNLEFVSPPTDNGLLSNLNLMNHPADEGQS